MTLVPGVDVADAPAARRALVVVGMHRSGTSAMTRTLSLLGSTLPKRMVAPHDDNVEGFWEPQSITELNDEILNALDSEWDDVFAFRPREYLANFDHFYLGRARDLLDQEFDGSELIVLKDPRISILTSFWNRALREANYHASYIIMVRNPLEVAESLRERNGFPREKSLLLWSSYMIALERDTREQERIFVSYDELISDWRSARRRIENGAAIPFPRDTAAAANEIDRFLNRKLRHHSCDKDSLFNSADVPDQVKKLYRLFLEACNGGDVDPADFEEVRGDLSRVESLVGPLVADWRARTRILANELNHLNENHADARKDAEALAQQLKAESAHRAAEAETANQAAAEFQQQLADLTTRIDIVEAEREDALALVETERARVGATTLELGSLARECHSLREQLDAAQAKLSEQADLESELEDVRTSLRKLQEIRDEEVERLSRAREQLQSQLTAAEAKSGQLDDAFKRDLRKAQEQSNKAKVAERAAETKLVERFQELATLTRLLLQKEQQAEDVQEQLQWVVALQQLAARNPTWWNILPTSWKLKRERRRMRRAKLFDADAYLRRYPDVAADGMDPLDHYLRHGIHEGRLRRPSSSKDDA